MQLCDHFALQGTNFVTRKLVGNFISRAFMRSLVEFDARIDASVVAATRNGIIYEGKHYSFETCEDTGSDLLGNVRCNG